MNLLPMLVAFGFVQMSGEMSGIGQILKAAFSPHERRYAYVTALAVPLIYYGISVLLGNVTFTGSPFSAMIAYFPGRFCRADWKRWGGDGICKPIYP